MNSKPETKELLQNLMDAILNYDTEGSEKAAAVIVANGIDPMLVIKETIAKSAGILHQRFEAGECFLPHLVMAGDAMIAASKVLEAAIPRELVTKKKVIVIATVEGDLHSVGKNIVTMVLRSGGFEVYDLGVDVKSSSIINQAKDKKADIIALSSLMTTTLPYQREVIEELESMKLRDKFKVMIGGGPVTKEWANKIGADGYGADSLEALEAAKKLSGI
jgi:dimethylamine corrinoid protein